MRRVCRRLEVKVADHTTEYLALLVEAEETGVGQHRLRAVIAASAEPFDDRLRAEDHTDRHAGT